MSPSLYGPTNSLLLLLDEMPTGVRPWEFALQLSQIGAKLPGEDMLLLQTEKEILHLQGRPPWQNPDRRFRFEVQFADGSVWPDLNRLNTPEVVQYLRRRLGSAKHPALRARYGDLLWEFASDHTAARAAAESYLTYAGDLLDADHNLYGSDAIARAADLALRLNDASLASTAMTLLMQRLERAAAESNENACSWLAEALLSVARAASQDQVQHAARLLEAVAATLAQESPQAFPVEDLCKKAARLHHASGDSPKEEIALRRAAECVEARAHLSEQDSHMRSAHFYREAQVAYQRLGDRAKTEEMRAKMREQSELAEQHEFALIETEVPWPAEQIDEWIAELRRRPLHESLAILSEHPDFTPSLERAESDWEESSKNAIFQQFVTPTVQRSGLPVWTALSPEEIRQYNVLQTLLRQSAFAARLMCDMLREILPNRDTPMCALFRRLVSRVLRWGPHPQPSRQARALADWLLTRSLYAGTDEGILVHALEDYFSRDWIGALHVLPQYIESLLRLVLSKLGLVTFSAARGRPGAFREKDLDTVLQTEELRKGLGEDMCVYAALVLSDPRGPQLRHMAAHGLLRSRSCSGSACDLLIHLLLLLARYEIKRSSGASGSEIPESSP